MPRRLVALAFALCAGMATAGPAGVPLPFEPVQVGQGTLRFVGMRIYDAELWAPAMDWRPDAPYVLQLTYARAIRAEALVKSTLEEISVQGHLPPQRRQAWEASLLSLFPDVKAGDRLAAVRLPGQGVSFHAGTRELGRIDDEAFAEAFFAIWLGPQTRKPALRARLLGG